MCQILRSGSTAKAQAELYVLGFELASSPESVRC